MPSGVTNKFDVNVTSEKQACTKCATLLGQRGCVGFGATNAMGAEIVFEFHHIAIIVNDYEASKIDCQPFVMNRQLPPVDAYAAAIVMAQGDLRAIALSQGRVEDDWLVLGYCRQFNVQLGLARLQRVHLLLH